MKPPSAVLRREAAALRAQAERMEELADAMDAVPAGKPLTPSECADELNVHVNRVYELIASGQLPAIDVGDKPGTGTSKRVPREDLEEFKRRRRTAPALHAVQHQGGRSVAS